jgi:IS5 family transposase
MLRTTNPQSSLWEAILPEGCLGLPAELARVDRLLDDPAFLRPLQPCFDPRIGRPGVPLDTYLRIMFLKFRYRLGYELVCREVADSISWQRFCRIPLGGQVPHPTTLVKLTRRLGEQTVMALNEALLATAADHKVLRTHRVRGRHHRGGGQRGLPDRRRAACPRDRQAAHHHPAHPGHRWGQPYQGAGPAPLGTSSRPPGRQDAAGPQRAGQAEGPGHHW